MPATTTLQKANAGVLHVRECVITFFGYQVLGLVAFI